MLFGFSQHLTVSILVDDDDGFHEFINDLLKPDGNNGTPLCFFPVGSPSFTLTLFLPNLDDDEFGVKPENGGDDTVVDGKAALPVKISVV